MTALFPQMLKPIIFEHEYVRLMLTEHCILPGGNGFKGILLDQYLAAGYYRMQHFIFTTQYTQIDLPGNSMPVFWLRSRVSKINENKTAALIRRKCSKFNVVLKPAVVTQDTEELYRIYRQHVPFNTAATCHDYLHQSETINPYDSWMIELRDGPLLIGTGFFDKGVKAISGLINFYHPAYAKYSLGKYLMLKKIDFARLKKMTYYYTGYISTANTKFDYKLFPDKNAIEVYLPVEKTWVPYATMEKKELQEYFERNIKLFTQEP